MRQFGRSIGFIGTFVFAVTATVGCVSLPAVTSGQIGCAENDITITNDEQGLGTRTWTAECHGKTYFCSAHGGGNNSTAQVSCKASDQNASAPTPAASGCMSDDQCKGARVCRASTCVDP